MRLSEMLRLGASVEVSETWDALCAYMRQPTQDRYLALRAAWTAAIEAHEDNDRAIAEFMADEAEYGNQPQRADGIGGRES